MNEIYKDVKGFEGYYQVSNLGNVKPTNPYNGRKPKLLTQENAKSKNAFYKRVKLHKQGIVKRYLVHRLVAEHFIDNPKNKPQVNHIDNNTINNSEPNLEWCTASENMQHSHKQGRQDKVTKVAVKAMIEANLARSKAKYDQYIGADINGRILLNYFRDGKHYKGNFKCVNCGKEFIASLDASLRNSNREKPTYCRSCSAKG